MNRAQLSAYVWSAHLMSSGAFILLAPTALFEWIGLHEPGGGMWLRLCGMLLGTMGYFFLEAARSNNHEFLLWGSRARMLPIVFLSIFVAIGLDSPLVLAFGVLDILAGLWTLGAIRADATDGAASV